MQAESILLLTVNQEYMAMVKAYIGVRQVGKSLRRQ